jgi:hypothetical protein
MSAGGNQKQHRSADGDVVTLEWINFAGDIGDNGFPYGT